MQRAQEPRGDLGQVGTDRARGLPHEVDRPQLERAHGGVVSIARRRRAEHDDRPWHVRHDVAERPEAIELRHVDVERDDLRVERLHLSDRLPPVTRRADDAELSRALDQLGDDLAHERAVVDDEHSRPLR
jgi:hypothetical protein